MELHTTSIWNKKINGSLISLNLQKALDRNEHNFVIEILKAFNFPDNCSFIQWTNILCDKLLVEKVNTNRFNKTRFIWN